MLQSCMNFDYFSLFTQNSEQKSSRKCKETQEDCLQRRSGIKVKFFYILQPKSNKVFAKSFCEHSHNGKRRRKK